MTTHTEATTTDETEREEQKRAEEERQRAAELEALLARYRQRFGDMPADEEPGP